MKARSVATLAVAGLLLLLAGCSPTGTPVTTVTVRLWDDQVAASYETSFVAFEREHPSIRVKVVTIPYADYFTRLRTDLASGTISDIFWTNAANYIDYERAGLLVDIHRVIDAKEQAGWTPQVVKQYTSDGTLWGVPQLTDPGIGLIYNRALLDAGAVPVSAVQNLSWDPGAPTDPLRQTLSKLTVDANGLTAAQHGFDPTRVTSWGYSASNDLNAMLLEYLGSNGASWQTGDRFTFDSPKGRQAIQYLVNLINVDRVAPPASQTNPPSGGDAALQLFLQGRIAVLQTGAYNLANVEAGAAFSWGVAGLPAGPSGAVSVTNGVIAAASAKSRHTAAQTEVLKWMGSVQGSVDIGARGAALPAVTAAQPAYFSYWAKQKVDVSPLIDVLANGDIQPPQGAAYANAQAAYEPILNDIFLGRLPVDDGLRSAEAAANTAE